MFNIVGISLCKRTWDESFEIYKNSGNMIFLFKIFFIFSQNICISKINTFIKSHFSIYIYIKEIYLRKKYYYSFFREL